MSFCDRSTRTSCPPRLHVLKVVLLDDVLSALDAHVGHHVWEKAAAMTGRSQVSGNADKKAEGLDFCLGLEALHSFGQDSASVPRTL